MSPIQTQFPATFLSRNTSPIDPALVALLAKFQPAGSDVGVFRDSTYYYLAHGLGSGRYATYRWYAASYETNATHPTIREVTIHRPVLSVEETLFTLSGTWLNGLASAQVYGGTYARTETTGDYAEWTTPAGTEWIGVWTLIAGNAGVAKVTIDGDATLANLLPTTQDLVDTGVLTNAVLVANGGTLNPTDRCLDLSVNPEANTLNYVRLLADDLAAGTHTVRLTVTGYKNGASSSTRLYVAGGAYGGTSLCNITTANVRMVRAAVLSTVDSRWEFAISYRANGSATTDWVGHNNTSFQTNFSIMVDGNTETLAAWDVAGGSQAVITLNSYFRLANWNSGNNVATAVTAYTLAPTTGLTVNWSLTWLSAGAVDIAYSAMLPTGAAFDKGSNVGSGSDMTLNANNDAFVANAQSQAAYLWNADGSYGALLYLPSLDAVLNYALCETLFLAIQDRSDGGINKIYATHNDIDVNVAPDEVWTGEANFRLQYFTDGANAALARS